MVYREGSSMELKIEGELDRERRAQLLNPNDPGVKDLWDKTRAIVERTAKPEVDIDQATEELLLNSLIFAYTDQLSGLPNKKGISIWIEATTAVAKRFNIPMAVIYMDGKDFSGINNRFGHNIGDQVIQILGEAFDQGLRRSTDIKLHLTQEGHAEEEPNIEVGREGGDEFVGVLLGARRSGAEVVGRRVNNLLADLIDTRLPMLKEGFGRDFELHYGVAELDLKSDQSGSDVVKAADDDLTARRAELGETRRS